MYQQQPQQQQPQQQPRQSAPPSSEFAALFSAPAQSNNSVAPPAIDDLAKSPPTSKPRAQTTNVYGATQFRLPETNPVNNRSGTVSVSSSNHRSGTGSTAGDDYAQLFGAAPSASSNPPAASTSNNNAQYSNLFGDVPATQQSPSASFGSAGSGYQQQQQQPGTGVSDQDFDNMFANIPNFGSSTTATNNNNSTSGSFSNSTAAPYGSGSATEWEQRFGGHDPFSSSTRSPAAPYDSPSTSTLPAVPATQSFSGNPYASRPLNDLDDLSVRLAALKR
jgi:hypothetical protein